MHRLVEHPGVVACLELRERAADGRLTGCRIARHEVDERERDGLGRALHLRPGVRKGRVRDLRLDGGQIAATHVDPRVPLGNGRDLARSRTDREQRGKAALAAEAIGDYARAEQLVRDTIAQVGRTGLISKAEILMEFDRGRPDRALAICLALDAGSTSSSYLPVAQAAMGDVEGARKSLAALVAEGERPVLLILPYFQLGDIETANRIAAQVDARPLGSLELLGEVSAYGGRLPFDPKVTPNFIRRMKEAGAPTGPMQPFKPGVKVDRL